MVNICFVFINILVYFCLLHFAFFVIFRQHGLSLGYLKLNGCRMISNSEIATALRPFYFVVHPDLFGRFPEQRVIEFFFSLNY